MSKRVKEMQVDEIRKQLGDTTELLAVDASKLDGVTANRWRLALRASNINALGVKNSLARKALHEAGVESLDPILAGPTTLIWGSEDIVALSKEIAKWAKELGDLEIKGGTVEGTTLSADEVDALSKSPGRLELIGQIAGLMLSPGAQLAGALLGPGGKLAGQLQAIVDKAGDE